MRVCERCCAGRSPAVRLAPAPPNPLWRAACWQDPKGNFIPEKSKFVWQRSSRIETVLVHIKSQFSKAEYRKLGQPSEGETYAP